MRLRRALGHARAHARTRGTPLEERALETLGFPKTSGGAISHDQDDQGREGGGASNMFYTTTTPDI
jgi:hypothetical protein